MEPPIDVRNPTDPPRVRLWWEIGIVLALTVGQSAIYSVLSFVRTVQRALAENAAIVEEVILLGYLFDRLRRLGWSWWSIIIATALLRAAYHAYQGVGAIIGNFVMGLVFGWCYRRWGRVMPLVIAHTLIDVVAFVGYPLAVGLWPALFGPS